MVTTNMFMIHLYLLTKWSMYLAAVQVLWFLDTTKCSDVQPQHCYSSRLEQLITYQSYSSMCN